MQLSEHRTCLFAFHMSLVTSLCPRRKPAAGCCKVMRGQGQRQQATVCQQLLDLDEVGMQRAAWRVVDATMQKDLRPEEV